jgi:hypothetical protein
MRRRPALGLLPLIALLTMAPSALPVAATSTADVVESLVPSTDRIQIGTGVNVTTTACPTPNTVESVSQRTRYPMAKGLAPFVPLDLGSISLSQTGSGVSFWHVPTTPRTWEEYELVCSDGSTNVSTDLVAVHPPTGEAWWAYNTYEQNVFHADRGYVFFLGIRTFECAVGGTATARIDGYDMHDWTFSKAVPDDGIVEWDVDIPADIHEGHYIISFECPTTDADTFAAETYVIVGLPELVESGSGASVLLGACLTTAIGVLLVLSTRRRRRTTVA